MSHGAGFMFGYAPVLTGGTVVMLPRWDPARMLTLAEEHRVQSVFLVPTHAQNLRALGGGALARHRLDALDTLYFNHRAAGPAQGMGARHLPPLRRARAVRLHRGRRRHPPPTRRRPPQGRFRRPRLLPDRGARRGRRRQARRPRRTGRAVQQLALPDGQLPRRPRDLRRLPRPGPRRPVRRRRRHHGRRGLREDRRPEEGEAENYEPHQAPKPFSMPLRSRGEWSRDGM